MSKYQSHHDLVGTYTKLDIEKNILATVMLMNFNGTWRACVFTNKKINLCSWSMSQEWFHRMRLWIKPNAQQTMLKVHRYNWQRIQ